MRISSLVLMILISLAANDAAGDPGRAGCFGKIEKKISPGDTATVFTTDSAAVRGMFPTVLPGGSTLYLRSVVDSSGTTRITIPVANIDRIAYTKHSRICRIFGFGAGFIFGAYAGASLAPDADGWFYSPEIGFGFVGAILGSFIGAAGGTEIDKLFSITLFVECE